MQSLQSAAAHAIYMVDSVFSDMVTHHDKHHRELSALRATSAVKMHMSKIKEFVAIINDAT